MPALQIRPATRDDVPLILHFIQQLAEYEKLRHEALATEQDLINTLFGERPYAEVVIAEYEQQAAGFALFFHNYSTFLGKPGLYLEDLFIDPNFRGKGIGKALLKHLARIANDHHCGRLEWSVLDWNTPAIEFYKSLGAEPMDKWTVNRIDGEALKALAE